MGLERKREREKGGGGRPQKASVTYGALSVARSRQEFKAKIFKNHGHFETSYGQNFNLYGPFSGIYRPPFNKFPLIFVLF
jgi:hypothetical protein